MRMNAWYMVGWISMLSFAVDVSIAKNVDAVTWVRLLFSGLLLIHGFIALGAFHVSGRRRARRANER